MQYMLLKKDEFLRERSEQGFIFSSFRLSGPDPEAGSVIGGPLFLVEHIYSLRLSQRDASLMKSDSNAGLYDYPNHIPISVFASQTNLGTDKINSSEWTCTMNNLCPVSVETQQTSLSDRETIRSQAIKTIKEG